MIRIRGRTGSGGIYRGVARILSTPLDYSKLEPGEVIVSPTATPELATVLDRAGAVVTDVGGALSHVVVVALQLGIPAVVNATGASRLFRDGMVLTVDGTNGVVIGIGSRRRSARPTPGS